MTPSRLMLPLALALAVTVPAAAQSEPTNGWINAGSPHNSSFYDWEELESWDDYSNLRCDTFGYRGSLGERIRVTLRSTAFDPWLLVGFREPNGSITGVDNDDSDGSLNSRVDFTIDDTRRPVHIVACALNSGTGAFTLNIERLANAEVAGGPADNTQRITGTPSAPSSPVNGELRSGQLHDSFLGSSEGLETWSFYSDLRCDNFDYHPQGGEMIEVTMRSSDFDAWLMVGYRNSDGSITGAINDDADGLNSRVRFQTDRSGRPVRIYGCARFDRAGDYELLVQAASGGVPAKK